MKRNRLSAIRIVFGVFFSILFFPIMFAAAFIVGNVWTVKNDVLNKEAILEEFDNVDGYEKLLDAVMESVMGDAEDTELQKRIVSEVFDEECIDEIFGQVLDKLFEGKDIDIDLEDKLEESISNAVVNVYDDEAENVIDAWIEGSLDYEYEIIYDACGDMIDEKIVEACVDRFGLDESMLSSEQIRQYLKDNPISEADKKLIIEECGKVVETYVDNYAGDIAEELNTSIEDALSELEESEELNEYSEIIIMIKSNANMAIIVGVVLFVICMLLLLLIFKAGRAGFVVPAVALIFSAIAYLAEFILALWVTGELSNYALEIEDSIEVFVFDFMMKIVEGVRNTILICGAVSFAIAVVMIIVGSILHTARKKRDIKAV